MVEKEFTFRGEELDGDGGGTFVAPSEIGKAIGKLFHRRAVRQHEGKRAIFEHGCHPARHHVAPALKVVLAT